MITHSEKVMAKNGRASEVETDEKSVVESQNDRYNIEKKVKKL